jgi:hypothetical protein
MKNYLKPIIVILFAAAFYVGAFLLKDAVSEVLIYIMGMGITLGLISYLMYHHWGKRKQKYGNEVKTRLHHE